MSALGLNDLLALNTLLAPEKQDEFSGSTALSAAQITPGSFGAPRRRVDAENVTKKQIKNDSKDIWRDDEVPQSFPTHLDETNELKIIH